ncbi:hypothetical protein ASPACDRAFT_40339 [Aspergillus aculeatus ATCC 16872]|uniref:ASST-domain-containing protein n=1 Tax=Aspergillus aculeatus (strain ATCC 16872 / CBS 172.66 / WB 5094) TaxID=690307 RepID=A0A1L9X3U8_ASPA1|nr:uncharacterized protein ASPACDRAFT_40339 [Aspergillus aculeatus ATCC 16872]OJK03024.1 hypothetical protein ASPACDRAFT_40339 [Aspergillus aculeatus ATCC 16872]
MPSPQTFTAGLVALAGLVTGALGQVSLLSSRQSVQVAESTGVWPWLQYQTEPSFNPPQLSISWNGEILEEGVILLEPRNFDGSKAGKQAGPLIMTSFGDLVWNGPKGNLSGTQEYSNFRIQELNETQYLTYWHGVRQEGLNASTGYGKVSFLDSSYETEFTVCPKLGLATIDGKEHDCEIDYNEQFVTPWGTLLVTAYNLTQVDLTSVNGSANGWVLDSQIHEVDIATSESVWKWSALDHIPLNASGLPLTNGASTPADAWDYVHLDSVSPYGDNLLLNGRHTWEVYAVERPSGEVMWTFNGETGGDWGIIPEESSFRWQYHTRVREIGDDFVIFSMFVNHNYEGANATSGTAPTVGREFHLSLPPTKDMSPLTLNTFNESVSLWSDSFGSMDYVPDVQNTTTRFISYGQLPLLREFKVGPGANVTDLKWEARYGSDNEVVGYRAYKGAWTGLPSAAPKLSVEANGTAFVSWNGATAVTAWKVYQAADRNETALTEIGIAQYRGFETAIDTGATGCFVVEPVLALNTTGVNSTMVCSS